MSQAFGLLASCLLASLQLRHDVQFTFGLHTWVGGLVNIDDGSGLLSWRAFEYRRRPVRCLVD